MIRFEYYFAASIVTVTCLSVPTCLSLFESLLGEGVLALCAAFVFQVTAVLPLLASGAKKEVRDRRKE